jgi:hypothetical protein
MSKQLLSGCKELNISCVCSVQKPADSVRISSVKQILTGLLAAGLGFGIPASLMQVRCSGLRGLQAQGWHPDHMFRIEEMRGGPSIWTNPASACCSCSSKNADTESAATMRWKQVRIAPALLRKVRERRSIAVGFVRM